MATPKIKVYKLDRNYNESADNDIQQASDQELLPIVDKLLIPDDALYLTGIEEKTETLISFGNNMSETIGVINDTVQLTSFPIINEGYFLPVFIDLDGVIPESEYVVDATTGLVTFSETPNGNVEADYYTVGSAINNKWVARFYPIYSGENYLYVERVKDSTGDLYVNSEYEMEASNGLFTFTNSISAPIVTYNLETDKSTVFISDHPNWVIGPRKTNAPEKSKLRTTPDIFKGTKDYPGDDSEDEVGNPIVQGPIPEWQESGFQIDYREGKVTFSEVIDGTLDPVRANFAYMKGIKNVTGQVLDLISDINGWTYKAVSEKYFPDSHNKRWVTRNINGVMPRNFYNDGEIIPKLLSINPYVECEPRSAITLIANQTITLDTNENQIIIRFTGNATETATVIINGISFIVGNIDDNFVWDMGTNREYTFTEEGESIARSADNYKFNIVWMGRGSLVFMVENFEQYSSSSSSTSNSSSSESLSSAISNSSTSYSLGSSSSNTESSSYSSSNSNSYSSSNSNSYSSSNSNSYSSSNSNSYSSSNSNSYSSKSSSSSSH